MPDEAKPGLRAQAGGKAVVDESGHPFCVCRTHEDAALVALAVNAHADSLAEDLLEVCEILCEVDPPGIMGPIHPTGSWQDRLRQAIDKAGAAIAKAKAGAA